MSVSQKKYNNPLLYHVFFQRIPSTHSVSKRKLVHPFLYPFQGSKLVVVRWPEATKFSAGPPEH